MKFSVFKRRHKKTNKPLYIIGAVFALAGIAFFINNSFSQVSYSTASFTSVGEHVWIVPEGVSSVDVLVVAGGGGGGSNVTASTGTGSGGGGAGGLIYETSYSVTPGQIINVAVGSGGISPAAVHGTGGNGENSNFGALVAIGGGGGGNRLLTATSGGSGGGVGYITTAGGAGTAGQGNDGGSSNSAVYGGAGGGGSAEPGVLSINHNGTNGGNGLYYGDIFGDQYGVSGWFAAGGGGGAVDNYTVGLGGTGGAGDGGANSHGTSALPGTGSGGGGSGDVNWKGGDGGSGAVLIRYRAAAKGQVGSAAKGLVGHWSMDSKDYVEGTENVVTNTNLDIGWSKVYQSNIIFNEINPPQGINSPTVGFERGSSSGYWYSYGNYAPQEPGAIYTVSLYVKTLDENFNIKFYTADNTETGRVNSGYISVPNDGKWHRIVWPSFQNPINSQSDSLSFSFTYNGIIGDPNTRTWLCAPQMEKKTQATVFVNGTRYSRLTDATPYSNHGNTDVSQPFTFTDDRFGNDGGAMSFDGVSNYVDAGNSSMLNTSVRTVSAWIKTTSTGTVNSSGTIVSKIADTPPHNGFALNINRTVAGKIYYYAGAWYETSSSNYNDGNWHHVVAVHEGTNLKFYKDGIPDGSYTVSSPTDYDASLLIGKERDGAPRLFDGSIDDVRIYDRALSESEVKSLYDSYDSKTSTGSLQKGLVLDMPLKSKYTKSETAGSEIMTDRTPYSNDGQNYGATVTGEGAVFDGVNDYVNVSSISNISSEMTFSVWIKPTQSFSDSINVLYGPAENGSTFRLYRNAPWGADSLGWLIYYKKSDLTSAALLKTRTYLLNEWTHTVFKYDSQGNYKVYINGEVDSSTQATDFVSWNPPNSFFRIGGYGSVLFPGHISNLMMYNRALSDEEVKTLYDRGRSDAGIIFQPSN